MQLVNNNLVIKRVHFIVSRPDYKDMFYRSMDMSVTRDSLNQIKHVLDTERTSSSGTLPISAISNNLSGIASIASVAGSRVNIAEGWGTTRLKVFIEVEQKISAYHTKISFVQGFTDYHDPSISGRIDENMPININTIITASKHVDPSTGAFTLHVMDSYNVIRDSFGIERYALNEDLMSTIRPKDIANHMSFVHDTMDYNLVNPINKAGVIKRDTPTTSSRINSDPTNYLERMINGVIDGNNNTSIGYASSDSFRSMSAATPEPSVFNNDLVMALDGLLGTIGNTRFTINNLLSIDPSVASRITLFENTMFNAIETNSTFSFVDTSNTEDHYKSNMETIVAHNAVNSIGAYMTENLVTNLSLTATNINNRYEVFIVNSNTFMEGIDIRPFLDRIKSKICNILMPTITQSNLLPITIVADIDLISDSTVSVSIGSSAPIVYRMPTFADSLYNPMIAESQYAGAYMNKVRDVMDELQIMPMEAMYTHHANPYNAHHPNAHLY